MTSEPGSEDRPADHPAGNPVVTVSHLGGKEAMGLHRPNKAVTARRPRRKEAMALLHRRLNKAATASHRRNREATASLHPHRRNPVTALRRNDRVAMVRRPRRNPAMGLHRRPNKAATAHLSNREAMARPRRRIPAGRVPAQSPSTSMH